MPTTIQRIAISGASGLIGTALVGHLRSEGHTVQRLVRRKAQAPDEIQWDPASDSVDIDTLTGVDAIIHLAGANVGDHRWTKKYRAEILNSRLLGTTAIAHAVTTVAPKVFISASAIGYYGETGNRAVTESDRGGDDFLAAVCREWEAAADLASNTRVQQVVRSVACSRSSVSESVENLDPVSNGGRGLPFMIRFVRSAISWNQISLVL
jgi:uncharacterized protein